jgi:hypothetical protein
MLAVQNGVLIWTGTYNLQTSTNVSGPYVNVSGAASPYTNSNSGSPLQFFRWSQ